ncbi:tetratricopeptide repeat protein [Sinorhizobium meliloti]|nr:tetratricopeptide repeat protein [Sinorhizobium meliloti]
MTAFFYASLSLLLLVSATTARAGVAEGIKTLEGGDIAGAVKEFQEAYEAGDADGAFYIGRLFEMGLGTDKDMRRAAELYAAAVSKKSAKAENRLGLMYLKGELVIQDYARATELICAAAAAGDPNGQFNCGLIYSEGKAVGQDWAKAIDYWQKAAAQHSVAALNYLGLAHREGNGVDADRNRAVSYFRRTAAAGNPMGLYELARAYSEGVGVDADPIMAHAYARSRGRPRPRRGSIPARRAWRAVETGGTQEGARHRARLESASDRPNRRVAGHVGYNVPDRPGAPCRNASLLVGRGSIGLARLEGRVPGGCPGLMPDVRRT